MTDILITKYSTIQTHFWAWIISFQILTPGLPGGSCPLLWGQSRVLVVSWNSHEAGIVPTSNFIVTESLGCCYWRKPGSFPRRREPWGGVFHDSHFPFPLVGAGAVTSEWPGPQGVIDPSRRSGPDDKKSSSPHSPPAALGRCYRERQPGPRGLLQSIWDAPRASAGYTGGSRPTRIIKDNRGPSALQPLLKRSSQGRSRCSAGAPVSIKLRLNLIRSFQNRLQWILVFLKRPQQVSPGGWWSEEWSGIQACSLMVKPEQSWVYLFSVQGEILCEKCHLLLRRKRRSEEYVIVWLCDSDVQKWPSALSAFLRKKTRIVGGGETWWLAPRRYACRDSME